LSICNWSARSETAVSNAQNKSHAVNKLWEVRLINASVAQIPTAAILEGARISGRFGATFPQVKKKA
jgi:hypothetical protein